MLTCPHQQRPRRATITRRIGFIFAFTLVSASCSPLQPNAVTTVAQKQTVTLRLNGDLKNKALLLKVFGVNDISGEETLELTYDKALPADGKVSLELGYGGKAFYGQLTDTKTKAVLARNHIVTRVEVGTTELGLNLKGDNRIDGFLLEMGLKTVGDLKKAKEFYEQGEGSPKTIIDIGCVEACHSEYAGEADRVYPYFDSFPYEVKNPAYKDMAVLVKRMIKDIKRNPRDPEVMPPGEGIEDKGELKLFDNLFAELSQLVDAEKYPIKRIELNWQVKNMPAAGKLTLSYDGENVFSGKFTEPLFKTDTLIGTLSAIAGKEKEAAIVKDAPLPPTTINLRSQTVYPQVTIDKSKVVIVIETAGR